MVIRVLGETLVKELVCERVPLILKDSLAVLFRIIYPNAEDVLCVGCYTKGVIKASHQQFEKYLQQAIDAIPPPYDSRLQNVAFILEDDPTDEQRVRLNLYPNETLFGLYEGVPLPSRNGTLKLLPDKITIFKTPLLAVSQSEDDLRDKIGRTVWHEVAHYYGLDHSRIHELENKRHNN